MKTIVKNLITGKETITEDISYRSLLKQEYNQTELQQEIKREGLNNYLFKSEPEIELLDPELLIYKANQSFFRRWKGNIIGDKYGTETFKYE